MFTGVLNFLGLLVAPATEYLKGRAKRQQVKEEGKIRLEEARARAAEALATRKIQVEADYDLEAIRQQAYSWKDEFMLLIIAFPFVGSFIPQVQDEIQKGWSYVAKAPTWYQVSFCGVIAAIFGLRWWFSRNSLRLSKSDTQKEAPDVNPG